MNRINMYAYGWLFELFCVTVFFSCGAPVSKVYSISDGISLFAHPELGKVWNHISAEDAAASDILFFQCARNNLKRDKLIDPANPQEWAHHFQETVFGSERHKEVEGKRIKQKHDEKKQRNAEKSHQTTEFEIALCQLGLLFLISHYVAGLFGDGCLSATVTGIAMIAVLCGCLHKERHRKIFFNITDAHTEKERVRTQWCTYPLSQFCLAAGPFAHQGHYLSNMIVIISWCCVLGCVTA